MAFHPLEQGADLPMGFVPLADSPKETRRRGFVPLQADPERPSIGKQVALENPATAIVETGLNMASQAVALPAAGLAGLATEAGKALGLTNKNGADVVHSVGEALTYQPRGEMGKAATELVTYPFQKLAEAGQWAGGKTLDSTGSPLAATVVDTAINALPMVIDPAIRAGKKAKAGNVDAMPTDTEAGVTASGVTAHVTEKGGVTWPLVTPEVTPKSRGFVPLNDAPPAAMPNAGARFSDAAITEATQAIAKPIGADAVNSASRGFKPLKEAGDGIADQNIPQGVRRSEVGDQVVLRPDAPELAQLRGARNKGLPGVAEQFRELPDARRTEAEQQPLAMVGAAGREQGLRAGERGVGSARSADSQASVLPSEAGVRQGFDAGGNGSGTRLSGRDNAQSNFADRNAHGEGDYTGKVAVQENISMADIRRRDAELWRVGQANRIEPRGATGSSETRMAAGEGIAADGLQKKTGFQPLNSEVQPMAGKVQNSWAPGANYAPLIDDAASPAGAKTVVDLPDPIRRENIIKDFSRALDSTVYEGRVKGKNRLGFFLPGVEEVRTKRFNDLEVAGHELAHLIDFRVPELSQVIKTDKALAKEFRSVSYDQKSLPEGFAEGMRLWLTQPETLQARAPGVAAFLDQFATTHAYGPALKKAQAEMLGWFGQDALNRARFKNRHG